MASVAPIFVDTSKDDVVSGTIRWAVDKESDVDDYPPVVDESIQRCIQTFDEMNEGDYECEMSINFKLINHDDDTKTLSLKHETTLKKVDGRAEENNDIVDFSEMTTWQELIDNDEGFIRDNKYTLQVDLRMVNIHRFRKIHRIDFTDSSEPTHDVVLVIEGEKVYVNKGHLSIYSPVFLKMFNGDFIEKNMKEIELKEIVREEFIKLLNVIYPPFKKITDENYEYLLKLGDQFEIDMVTNQIEKFLIPATTISVAAKLLLAERFRLEELKNHCLGQLKTTKDVRDMQDSDEFKSFSDAMKAVLFDKIMKFTD